MKKSQIINIQNLIILKFEQISNYRKKQLFFGNYALQIVELQFDITMLKSRLKKGSKLQSQKL
jgi:hypothetical protein